ncbi:topoisomerase DNA-binding C4 zinc finger domain-containing protein [SAR86 cluster bacterium]|nr:topoisomerase DNA-binding C4 zinc finger domain-containing protein [SAR86 cluster bacterium]
MVLRRNRRDGNKFWGCSNFPRCRGTLSIAKARKKDDRIYH